MAAGVGAEFERSGEQVSRSRILRWCLASALFLALSTALAFRMRPVSLYRGYSELRLVLSGAESRTTNVAGFRVHYYALGPAGGPVVVLVHGLGGRSEDWRNLAPYFAKAGYRVYLPDLLGYGHSEQPRDFSYSITDEAAVVVGFFDVLNLKQVDLGGWSMGGWIVQRVAIDHPGRVRRLMLFDSAGINEKPTWNLELFTPTTAAEVDQLDDLLMPHPPRVPAFVAEDILRSSRRNSWISHRAVDSMLLGRDVTDNLLPHLKMPVLIVWGSEDRITPLSHGEKMHRMISQSQLSVIPGCGHLAPVQCADQIGPTAVEFLKR
jgi:pimeloyl-ACP methyl ester carboxylesterase